MAGVVDPVKERYLKVLRDAVEMVRQEAKWLGEKLEGCGAASEDIVRVADRELMGSAVDVAVMEGGGLAGKRLGVIEGSPHAAVLEKRMKTVKGKSLNDVRGARLKILTEWAAALTYIIKEVTLDEITPEKYIDVPILRTAPEAPTWRFGYKGEMLLSISPLEITQVLNKRAVVRKRQLTGSAIKEEEANIKIKMQKMAKAGKSLVGKRKWLPHELNPLADKPFKGMNMYQFPSHDDELEGIAKVLHKQKTVSVQKQERDDELKRQRIARAVNKSILGFWEHTSKIIKKTTDTYKETKRREILEGKKDLLLAEAKRLADQLANDLRGIERPADIDAEKHIPLSPLLKCEERPLRAYQRSGVNWLVTMHERGLSGILADEMGLGKTIQTIALLAHLATHEKIWGPHLVVVPTSVLLNWEIEFKRWAPGFNLLLYYGTQKVRTQKRRGWTGPGAFDVCIASYQTVVADILHFKRIYWEYMILDEAQVIKNYKSKKWNALHELKTTRRLLLSGTPLQNNMMEMWSLLRFLLYENPLFASDTNFSQWFNSPMTAMLQDGECNTQVVEQLHQVLRPYILRRLKRNVEAEMPKKIEKVLRCKLSKRQRTLYSEYINKGETQAKINGSYMGVIAVLMSLRQVCNHPSLFEPRPTLSPFCPTYVPSAALYTVIPPKGVTLTFPRLLREVPDTPWVKQTSIDIIGGLQPVTASKLFYKSPKTIQKEITSMKIVGMEGLQGGEDLGPGWKSYLTALHALETRAREERGEWWWKRQKRVIQRRRGLTVMGPFGLVDKTEGLPALYQPGDAPLPKNVTLCRLPSWSLREPLPETHSSVIGCFRRFRFVTPKVAVPPPVPTGIRPPPLPHVATTHKDSLIQLPDPKLLTYDCGKLQVLSTLLPELKRQGHRVLIFTQMTKVLDILEAFLSMHGFLYLRLDGTTKVEERQYRMELYNSDTRYFCFILSTRSGGMGINLTGADTVIFYDSDWNPAMDLQAQDRCHRIGQTRNVTVYRLISKHSIEENILVKARQKRTLINLVMKGGKFDTANAMQKEKVNVAEFFHPLDDDDWKRLEEMEDMEEPPQDLSFQKIENNPLIELEDEADREAFRRVRAEINAANGDDEPEPAPPEEQHDLSTLLDPLQQYSLRMYDEFSHLNAEATISSTELHVWNIEQRELHSMSRFKKQRKG
eukprot:TRINITY_DN1862_c0_g1_i1.p1 TRINITY_DN1862_c0_g1~~TRINITY_DN1862_c0_g1_i1.p1  ORF type:complete len:1177 (+),score=291.91 TRINITY_DN1862_c0_g1_i1:1005-4535(+)